MNRIFAGLWFGKKKTHFPTFLQPFALSLRTLYTPGNFSISYLLGTTSCKFVEILFKKYIFSSADPLLFKGLNVTLIFSTEKGIIMLNIVK